MYKKPVIFQTEDLSEGVYAASGSKTAGVTFTADTFQPYYYGNPNSGTINYTVTAPAGYTGKHVILTFNFNKNITDLYGLGGSQTTNGNTGTLNIWSLQSGTVTVHSNEGDPGLTSISIAEA